jgi:imidazole glycerol-phosphate synthase subunit HisH
VKPNVLLLNSGGSNYTSLQAAFERLGARCEASIDPRLIQNASHVVLPGVGSAGAAMQAIAENGLAGIIHGLQQPLLGICLGMQVLFEELEESAVAGLGLIPGKVSRLPESPGIRVPHMGWNSVSAQPEHPLFAGINGADFYFVHSYAAPISPYTIASCTHGAAFSAAVADRNFFGVQFHPERSGPQGLKLLANFLEMRA